MKKKGQEDGNLHDFVKHILECTFLHILAKHQRYEPTIFEFLTRSSRDFFLGKTRHALPLCRQPIMLSRTCKNKVKVKKSKQIGQGHILQGKVNARIHMLF